MHLIREQNNHIMCCLGVRNLKTLTDYEKKRLDLYIQRETPNHYFALSCGNTEDVKPTTTEGQLTLCARSIRHCLIFDFVFSSSANKLSAVATGTASNHPALLCDKVHFDIGTSHLFLHSCEYMTLVLTFRYQLNGRMSCWGEGSWWLISGSSQLRTTLTGK